MARSSNGAKQESIEKDVAETIVEAVGDENRQEETEGKTVTIRKPSVQEEEDSDDEYVDHNFITISLVNSYSLYHKANDKVLPKRKDFIGSSINSSRILSSNKEEMDAYLPNIIGVSPSDPSFMLRVKQYFNNIKIGVDELGKTFDISFRYRKKSDYLRIQKELDKIDAEYAMAKKSDDKSLHEALNTKITKLNLVESTKYKYGSPINVDDYLMYRHCLLYPHIAKDLALINSDKNIRFYIKDERKEQERVRKHRTEINKAKQNYVALLVDDSLFEAVYIQYCVMNNLPIVASLMEDQLTKESKLDKFSVDEPVKFNKIFNNKDVKLMATIEKLIARGILNRLPHNQNITTVDGEFIGANIGEAVNWFKNVNNTSSVNAYLNQLKNI